jgi:hypothetical protein
MPTERSLAGYGLEIVVAKPNNVLTKELLQHSRWHEQRPSNQSDLDLSVMGEARTVYYRGWTCL